MSPRNPAAGVLEQGQTSHQSSKVSFRGRVSLGIQVLWTHDPLISGCRAQSSPPFHYHFIQPSFVNRRIAPRKATACRGGSEEMFVKSRSPNSARLGARGKQGQPQGQPQ